VLVCLVALVTILSSPTHVAFGAAPDSKSSTATIPDPYVDVDNFAKYFGVSRAEAGQRLELQDLAGELDGLLATRYPKTYSGLWIDQQPDFRVTVAFTEFGRDELGVIGQSGLGQYANVVVVDHALSDLNRALAALVPEKDAPLFDARIDVRKNRAEVLTPTPEAVEADLAAQGALSSSTVVVRTAQLSERESYIYGGLFLVDGGCTSGYGIIKAGTGTRGIVTAGHCPNTQYYGPDLLPFQAQAVGGAYDEQWHTAPTYTVENWINIAPGTTRTITSRQFYVNQPVGATVCKYGMTTGATCGEIVTRTYQPSACISGATATYVQVSRSGVNESEGGDSGAPWYSGHAAWGMHDCGAGNDAIYMAEDYIEYGLNITVMTAP
jgi:hypothetical protein